MTTKEDKSWPIFDAPTEPDAKPARLSKRERAEKLLREDRVDELWRAIKCHAASVRQAASARDAVEACAHADAALQALEELDRISKGTVEGA